MPIGGPPITCRSGRIYLKDNALLEEPLRLEHIKPRLLGHWGTTPGLNFLYVHLNRLIKQNELNMMYVIGPGHGGPGVVAQTISKALIPNAIPQWSAARTVYSGCSGSSPGRMAFPAMSRRKRPVLSTKAASWAIRLLGFRGCRRNVRFSQKKSLCSEVLTLAGPARNFGNAMVPAIDREAAVREAAGGAGNRHDLVRQPGREEHQAVVRGRDIDESRPNRNIKPQGAAAETLGVGMEIIHPTDQAQRLAGRDSPRGAGRPCDA